MIGDTDIHSHEPPSELPFLTEIQQRAKRRRLVSKHYSLHQLDQQQQLEQLEKQHHAQMQKIYHQHPLHLQQQQQQQQLVDHGQSQVAGHSMLFGTFTGSLNQTNAVSSNSNSSSTGMSDGAADIALGSISQDPSLYFNPHQHAVDLGYVNSSVQDMSMEVLSSFNTINNHLNISTNPSINTTNYIKPLLSSLSDYAVFLPFANSADQTSVATSPLAVGLDLNPTLSHDHAFSSGLLPTSRSLDTSHSSSSPTHAVFSTTTTTGPTINASSSLEIDSVVHDAISGATLNSASLDEAQSCSKKPHNSRIYVKWTEDDILALISWWDIPINYANWSSRFKTQSYRSIQLILADKTTSQIKNKADGLFKSYNEAMGVLKEASRSPRKRAALTYTQIKAQCRYFEQMHAVFRKHSDCSLEQLVLDQLQEAHAALVGSQSPPQSQLQSPTQSQSRSQAGEPLSSDPSSTLEDLSSTLKLPANSNPSLHIHTPSSKISPDSLAESSFPALFSSLPTLSFPSTSMPLSSPSPLVSRSEMVTSTVPPAPPLFELGIGSPLSMDPLPHDPPLGEGLFPNSTLHAKLLALQGQELRTKQIMAELEIQKLKTWSEAVNSSTHNVTHNPKDPHPESYPSTRTPSLSLSYLHRYDWLPVVQSLLPKGPDMLGAIQRQEFKARRALMELDLFRINSMLLAMEPPGDIERSEVKGWKDQVQSRYDSVKDELDRLRDLLEKKQD
ncbi:hypothetical protein BASA50_000271 [Batrachochytrium salamandrivorans]|uniref:Uncharacterized protein n=1 Tax=Batrachochytrium salamandrivorans TaxID=1357716 RepID=A0ABQ8EXK3_9FUNG|nr:hypothetical protein BASA60_001036 [Batrachochytrium salamandrivorans]KAH6586907.1 hypothetical protein BASA50_000271 [Batrachochytrium salamandrivorans]KAH9250398.1 hypothetical protein BASA81_011806 [Batrachochytrium salamandrivorans]KAJ1341457.1 hypothetical protein BSLG_003886 [Batrachochytrium salamandrivorans]